MEWQQQVKMSNKLRSLWEDLNRKKSGNWWLLRAAIKRLLGAAGSPETLLSICDMNAIQQRYIEW